jgi:hypothetical protein
MKNIIATIVIFVVRIVERAKLLALGRSEAK